jgi:hypothetical protein
MTNLTFSFLGICLLSQASFVASAAEAPLNCSGSATFQSSYVDLNCINGSCSGWVPSQTFLVKGKCTSDKEISYLAEGIVTEIYVTGICKAGVVSANSFSQNVALYGECSFEDNYYGSFYSSIYSPSSFATGFCQENGMSRLYFNGVVRQVTGLCRQN